MTLSLWNFWRNLPSSSRSSIRSRNAPKRRPLYRRLELEALEDRIVPTTVPTPVPIPPSLPDAHTTYRYFLLPNGQPYQSAGPVGYTPQQIQTAYGINQLYGIVGNGAGQTIALVDAYDAPNFVDSTSPNFVNSDLHKFDVQFGLPDPPSFMKLNQTGGTTLPGVDPAGPPNDWEGEESLDVEWAHSIAPGANIILFEANSASFSDLFTAVQTAANYPGVSVVSMSFGGPEFSGVTSLDNIFTTPAGHQGVTFLASSGDSGSYVPGTSTVAVNYPAASPNVLSVGGTSLTLNPNNTYKSETAWGNGTSSGTAGGSGGGISQFESEPTYQQSVQNTGFRTVPDVAFDADPATGVAVYDSYDFGSATPWVQIGGTSLASPSWAGLIAIADQGLVARGEPTLDGPSQTLPKLYELYKILPADFHDITSGSNGAFTAGPGYDEVTGMGTPAANLLIPDLIGLTVQNTLSGVTEGQPLTNVAVANFNDPTGSQPVSDYTATITWGNGAVTNGTVVADGGNLYTVLGSNTYINGGPYPLTVTVQNTVNELVGVDTTTLDVADAPLTGSAQVVNGVAGSYVTNALVAIFTDTDPTLRPASHYSATIEWNEGNGLVVTSLGTIEHLFGNTFAVYGNSPYSLPEGGLFPLDVIVTDLQGGARIVIGSSLSVAHNQAIPPLTPIDQADTGPVTPLYSGMEDALTNLLHAEQQFLDAFRIGSFAQKEQAFGNLFNAFFAYQVAVFTFDMQLPGA